MGSQPRQPLHQQGSKRVTINNGGKNSESLVQCDGVQCNSVTHCFSIYQVVSLSNLVKGVIAQDLNTEAATDLAIQTPAGFMAWTGSKLEYLLAEV